MSSEEELFAKLDRWLTDQPAEPTIFEVVHTRNAEVIAAFILRHFRAAAKKAVADRLELETSRRGRATWERTGAIGRLVEWLAQTWRLSIAEQLQLLGLGKDDELVAVRNQLPEQVSREVLERLAMLVDIYQGLHSLLPKQEAADGWIRRSNEAPMFNGGSAMDLMLEKGWTGIRDVRAYLWSQVW